ncbi:hypothetical protein NL108_015527 [Boleophthalmus pectinirostris]|uniref:proteasome activator complex subunit 1 n=1 Tax=Boleophthalmus pectinirostris TaxID=150288 RepID=UPI0024305D18|nr:proteasome activator complex subunit 1 [Boleophthalmus pectinirostris]XP_055006936.1 proteasome activator complex subunit 1 [Boleophthalmus pectinirostris]KAJ0059908.1 hypothetical protein NL108_015527 [Boleophthalmus pectinirostris]
MTSLNVRPDTKQQVDSFCQNLNKEAEELVKTFFPQKIEEMQLMLTTSFICKDLETLKVLLDIPMPDPAKEEAKRKKKEEEEKKKGEKDKGGEKEEDAGPPCGPICVNETVEGLLKNTKSQISTLKEKLNTVSLWMQLQVPKVEDGNNFGVAVQEKVFELLTNTRTKIEAFQTLLAKYSNERGDAVAKAAKSPHVGDYRELVHQLDQFLYCELRLIVLEIRNIYAVLFDIITKNYVKIKKPKGDGKAPIY